MTQSSIQSLITVTNWNHTHYLKDEKKAFISMAALPDCGIFYSVTILEGEHKELGSKDFDNLNFACQYLNKNFRAWEFKNLAAKEEDSGSGCSSCSAH